MKRSRAPSQVRKPAAHQDTLAKTDDVKEASTDVTISRMPMFGFLEIPQALNKQFRIPSGCVITDKSIALRKVKKLGGSKKFELVRPGFFGNISLKHSMLPMAGEEGENEEEELPTNVDLPPFEPLVLWSDSNDPNNKIEVIPKLASKLRPHQREGVQFLFECTMGLRGFDGQGCILADDMGLGKTLMSITLLWTLLNQGYKKGQSAVRKVVVVCPTSLVGNWDNELRKWVGDFCPTFAVKSEPKKIIKNFLQHRGKCVLIVSYETQRLYSKLFENAMNSYLNKPKSFNKSGEDVTNKENLVKNPNSLDMEKSREEMDLQGEREFKGISNNNCCDLLICDEAHKLKNASSGLAISLNKLPAKKRILLSGTPMQNELLEFFNMVNFSNPLVLGTAADFKRRYERPILLAREPDATDGEKKEAQQLQKELSTIVNEFILKRGNILNAKHLPPKLVQFVCCKLTPLQEVLYERLLQSKDARHIREGKQLQTLNSIRQLISICSHPKMLLDAFNNREANKEKGGADEDLDLLMEVYKEHLSSLSSNNPNQGAKVNAGLVKGAVNRYAIPKKIISGKGNSSGSNDEYVDPNQSGKMQALHRLMQTMRAVRPTERIVVVSNYTQTLDLISTLCRQCNWPALRLDGTVGATRRTKIVDEFNDPRSGSFAFLLSSKAGGCGINLIGGNRLVLFDPDWNPASDKQAAARIWREGQKRRCFIYRFMSTGTIEEKIIQRQLSKEGLADIVDDKEQVNQFSTDELKQLFSYNKDTLSDTHETLRCQRCKFISNLNEVEEEEENEKNEKGRGGRAGKGKKGPKGLLLNEQQVEICSEFLSGFLNSLKKEAFSFLQRQKLKIQQNSVSSSSGVSLNLNLIPEELSSIESFEDLVLPFEENINELLEQLKNNEFATLPEFSRKQREVFQSSDQLIQNSRIAKNTMKKKETENETENENSREEQLEKEKEEKIFSFCKVLFSPSFSLFSDFLKQWTGLVPTLTSVAKSSTKKQKTPETVKLKETTKQSQENSKTRESVEEKEMNPSESSSISNESLSQKIKKNLQVEVEDGVEVEVEEEDFVEQVGCPEETDFNRWSHHRNVQTCDDELLGRALCDESTVSFVFGLEVNWSLLQERDMLLKEEVEQRRLQQQRDLVELNERRQREKDMKGGKIGEAGSSEEEEEIVVKKKKKEKKEKFNRLEGESKKRERKAEKKDSKNNIKNRSNADGTVELAKDQSDKLTPTEQDFHKKTKIGESSSSGGGGRRSARKLDIINPEIEIDPFFRADWEYLRRHITAGRIDSNDFNSLFKALKRYNNNWRTLEEKYYIEPIIPDSQGKTGNSQGKKKPDIFVAKTVFTRMQGFKIEDVGKEGFRQGYDYFETVDQLKFFMRCQAILLGDENLFKLKVDEDAEVQASNENNDDTSRREEEKTAAPPKRRRTVIDSESENEFKNVVKKDTNTIEKSEISIIKPIIEQKRKRVIDSDESEDEMVVNPAHQSNRNNSDWVGETVCLLDSETDVSVEKDKIKGQKCHSSLTELISRRNGSSVGGGKDCILLDSD